ncbi:hypothetical protein [Streptomyces brasiliscabiei]|uniref:hypothetical protein n=1 Tax=Streptomyces brasiliscabiei TaxID=2736302 RepID=UPI001C121A33|nr:hypothetical protein [Streptomyces brasiliscabiei]
MRRSTLSRAERAETSPTAALLNRLCRPYAGTGWTRIGTIPDFAADPHGTLRPTSIYYKRPGTGPEAGAGPEAAEPAP